MPNLMYEYSGKHIPQTQIDQLNRSINRNFYVAECQVKTVGPYQYMCNSRVSAGRIPISMHRTIGLEAITRRSRADVRTMASETYTIWLPLHGTVQITQCGRTVKLQCGSFALAASNEPLCVSTSAEPAQDHLSMQIQVPTYIVDSVLLNPKRYCGRPFRRAQEGSDLALGIFESLFDASTLDRISADSLAIAAAETILRSMRTAGGPVIGSRRPEHDKLQTILDYVQMHHTSLELSTSKVADACAVSPRYIQYLFKREGMSFSSLLWKLRLDNARRQLLEPALRHKSISEVAYSSGFKSTSHFSRMFRSVFAVAPSEFRERERRMSERGD